MADMDLEMYYLMYFWNNWLPPFYKNGFLLDDINASQDFMKNVMAALKSSSTEGELQDGIFYAMRKLENISVPQG